MKSEELSYEHKINFLQDIKCLDREILTIQDDNNISDFKFMDFVLSLALTLHHKYFNSYNLIFFDKIKN